MLETVLNFKKLFIVSYSISSYLSPPASLVPFKPPSPTGLPPQGEERTWWWCAYGFENLSHHREPQPPDIEILTGH